MGQDALVFEFHGWATLRSTASSRDDEWQDEQDGAAVRAVETLVREAEHLASRFGGVLSVRQVNGEAQVWLHGLRNHRQDQVVRLWAQIAAAAPGSYGLLHIHDDEADDESRWSCWTMLRGDIEESVESRLTPHFGRVEDPPSYDS